MSKPNFYLKLADMITDMILIDADRIQAVKSHQDPLKFILDLRGTGTMAYLNNPITTTLALDKDHNPKYFLVEGKYFTYKLQDFTGNYLDWMAREGLTFHIETPHWAFTRIDDICRFGEKGEPGVEVKNKKLNYELIFAQIWVTSFMLHVQEELKRALS